MLDVLKQGHADAALAASIFHFRKHSIGEVKNFLSHHGVPIRLV
jgi:cyclase